MNTTSAFKKLGAMALSWAILPSIGWSQEFKILGLRAMGMGGAQVAASEGATTSYWNPGNLPFQKRFDIEVPVSAKIEATGNTLDTAQSISDVANQIDAIQTAQTGNSALSLTQVNDFLNAVDKILALNRDGSGALVGVQGGGNVRISNWSLSVNNFTEVGASPFVDPSFSLGGTGGTITFAGDGALNDAGLTSQRDTLASLISQLESNFQVDLGGNTAAQVANQLLNDAQTNGLSNTQINELVQNSNSLYNTLSGLGVTGGSGDFNDNDSDLTLRGTSLTEYSLGYGHEVPIPEFLGKLGVGGNIKLIQGYDAFMRVSLLSGEDVEIEEFDRQKKSSVRPAFDLGAQWITPLPFNTRVGIVGRNLNSPTFDQPDNAIGEAKYKHQAQVRAGAAIQPISRLTLAMDLDLTNNPTHVAGFSSRTFGMGAEFDLWLLKLRAGLLKNITGKTPLTYTAGIGLRVFCVALDIGAAMSSKTVKLDNGDEIPANAQVGLNLGIKFGGPKDTDKK